MKDLIEKIEALGLRGEHGIPLENFPEWHALKAAIQSDGVKRWATGARFALEQVTKIDRICWTTDTMREVGIVQAGKAVLAEKEKMLAAAGGDTEAEKRQPTHQAELGPDGKEWAKTEAGYKHVDSMIPRADGVAVGHYWYGWALRGAFVAGAEWQEQRGIANRY